MAHCLYCPGGGRAVVRRDPQSAEYVETQGRVEDFHRTPEPPPLPASPASEPRSARSPWGALDWLLVAAITTLGAALRFVRLSFPHSVVFDETYYAKDACLYLGRSQAFCGTPGTTEQSYVHPPLGKWIIAAGIKIFGYNSFGWRFMAAVFGTALIVLVYFMARKLFGRWAAAAASLLVATDFLLIVQSRVAMLDIFLAFFVVLGFLFVACDWERVRRLRVEGAGRFDIRWRVGAALAFGAAGAVKWSGVYALAGGSLLVLFWTVGTAVRLRRADHRLGVAPRAPSPLLEFNATLLCLGVLPVLVYLGSYSVWLYDHGFSLVQLWRLHGQMLEYHLHLTAPHTYASRAYTWPIVYRPVAYYFTGGASGKAAHILAFGNPATWFPALGAGVWFLWRAIRRRYAPETVVMGAWLVQYVPWLAVSRPQFFFYMTPIAPFMMVAVGGTLWRLGRGSRLRTLAVLVYLAVAAGFLVWYFYPIVTGVAIPFHWWQEHMWFRKWI